MRSIKRVIFPVFNVFGINNCIVIVDVNRNAVCRKSFFATKQSELSPHCNWNQCRKCKWHRIANKTFLLRDIVKLGDKGLWNKESTKVHSNVKATFYVVSVFA